MRLVAESPATYRLPQRLGGDVVGVELPPETELPHPVGRHPLLGLLGTTTRGTAEASASIVEFIPP